jgi:hypothetical protein
MKTCAEYGSELAVAAAGGGELSDSTAQHLKSCMACEAIFIKLSDAAKLQRETAHALPVPEKNFDLGNWFSQQIEPSTSPEPIRFPLPRIRRYFTGFAALACVVLITFGVLELHHRADRAAGSPQISAALPAAEAHEKASVASADQTLRGLRHSILGKPDGIESAFPRQFQAAVSNPVRLKDAYFQND